MSDKYIGDGPYVLECLSKNSKKAGYDFGFVGSYYAIEKAKEMFLYWSSCIDSDFRVIENSSGAVLMEHIHEDSDTHVFCGSSVSI